MVRSIPALSAAFGMAFSLSLSALPAAARTGATVAPFKGLSATAWEAAYARPLDDAAADTDRNYGDAIQAFLYVWLKPVG
ncbi:MAG: hypothetical protein J0H88_23345 [Sphingomonadales bacterium]|nr:hypothetical protein [Sphingomonadales bacterium]